KEKGWTENSIPGGSPDNPLGRHRIELTLPVYAIHGTNNPWAVGRLVTHGCVRMYPEDIEQFFDIIRVGSPGEFTYQPVKVGILYGKVYAEVHEDIYKLVPDLWEEAQKVVRESGWGEMIDQTLLRAAVEKRSGVPVDITLGSRPVLLEAAVDQKEDLPLESEKSRADRYDPEVATAEVEELFPEPALPKMDENGNQPADGIDGIEEEEITTETNDGQSLESQSPPDIQEQDSQPEAIDGNTRETAKVSTKHPAIENLGENEPESQFLDGIERAATKLETPRPEQRSSKKRSLWRRLLFLGGGDEEEAERAEFDDPTEDKPESQPSDSAEVTTTEPEIPRPDPARLDMKERNGRNAHTRRVPLE
ncbi:MAG: L,D-transpeptidase, partial [Candidatus Binatia bacterium]